MIEITRIYIGISLFLISATLILHLVAMQQNHWKIYEHRTNSNRTIFIGIFRRCDKYLVELTTNAPKMYSICDDNKYAFHGNDNQKCTGLNEPFLDNINAVDDTQKFCNLNNSLYHCAYSSITKGLISCTIIAACTLGISLILIFSHILINQFKYKIHMYIAMITLLLLFLGLLFILIALILFGSTLTNDLHQYRYNLDCRFNAIKGDSQKEQFKKNVIDIAGKEYDIRVDWAAGLEIAALILSSFTLITQVIYLISTYRNRIG